MSCKVDTDESYGDDVKIIVPSSGDYANLILLLHGLGSDASDMEDLAKNILSKNAYLKDSTKVICPNAPIIPLTLMMSFPTTAWVDIKGINYYEDIDLDDYQKASSNIISIIASEFTRNPELKVIIGGFSMGASLAMYTFLTSPLKIHGLIFMSGWVPIKSNKLKESVCSINSDSPIIHTHGNVDPIIAYSGVTKTFLSSINYKNYKLCLYNMGHSIIDEAIMEILNFTISCFNG